jgi:hypothetical protein
MTEEQIFQEIMGKMKFKPGVKEETNFDPEGELINPEML